jgi:hypothetical protein
MRKNRSMNYNDPYSGTSSITNGCRNESYIPEAYTSSHRSQYLIQGYLCDMCSDKDLHARCTTKIRRN